MPVAIDVDFLETHFEVVMWITKQLDLKDSLPTSVVCKYGRGGLYELAEMLTEEFQNIHSDRQWDGEFFDEIEAFLEMKNNLLHEETLNSLQQLRQ